MSKAEKLKLEPLKVTCTSSDCDNNLHCFRATRNTKAAHEVGAGGIALGDFGDRAANPATHLEALRAP